MSTSAPTSAFPLPLSLPAEVLDRVEGDAAASSSEEEEEEEEEERVKLSGKRLKLEIRKMKRAGLLDFMLAVMRKGLDWC